MMEGTPAKKDCEGSREVWDFNALEAVQQAVAEQLKVAGLDIPRGCGVEHRVTARVTRKSTKSSVFGSPLSSLPAVPYQYGKNTFRLPKVFVVLVKCLEEHVQVSGLFRKAGSASRLKALKLGLEQPLPQLPGDTSPHDAASLLKQFLRELPTPLIPVQFTRLLEACVATPTDEGPATPTQRALKDESSCVIQNLLLLCLLLPPMQLKCLCVVLRLLHCVALKSGESLMDASNLAVVMAPSLMVTEAVDYNEVNCSLRRQKGIVELLIQNATSLGVVPRELGLRADELSDKFGIGKTANMDRVNDGSGSGRSPKKQRSSAISEMVMGIGNRLRRHKRAGSGDLNFLPPKKKTKVCDQETSSTQCSRTGGVAPGTIAAPLLGTATKFNFSLGRSIKLPFSPLKSPASLRSATASPSISSPVGVTTPSSLLRRSLHAPVVKSGLGSDGTEDATGLVSTDSSATPHSTEYINAASRQEDVECEENPAVMSTATTTGTEAETHTYPDGTNESYKEAVNCGSVATGIFTSDAVRDIMSCDSHMTLAPGVREQGVHEKHSNSRYSATLGINTGDLTRKSLTGELSTGTNYNPLKTGPLISYDKPFSSDWSSLGSVGVGDLKSGSRSSPASLSASLGITSIKPTRTPGTRRHRSRSRGRQKAYVVRERQNENREPLANQVPAEAKVCLDHHDATSSPLPPLVHIVEQNVANCASAVMQSHYPLPTASSHTTGGSQNKDAKSDGTAIDSNVPGSSADTVEAGDVAEPVTREEGGGFGTGKDNYLRRSQWFKSPWKRGIGSEFTPIKEGDQLSRRALAYVVAGSKGHDAPTVEPNQDASNEGCGSEARPHPPIVHRTRANIAVQEWTV